MATFSVNDQVRRALGTGNGTLATFDFDFQVNATSDIKVYVDGTLKTETTHYTVVTDSDVAGLNTDGTGTVKFTGGNIPANNAVVTILSDVPAARTSVYTAGGNITATSLEQDFDTLTMLVGDREERDTRALTAPVNDPASIDMTLPAKDTRKGTVLGFNATSGDPEAGPTIADVSTLAAITADIATLADIEDGTDATDAIQTVATNATNVNTVAGISGNVTTVAGIASDVTSVAGDATDIGTVAGLATEIGRLGTADAVADMALLATADVVSDLNTLATSAIVNDLDALADLATELDALGDITSNITTVAGISSNVTTVAGDSADIQSVAGNATNLNTVAGSISNVNSVAGSISNVNTVASNISGVNSFGERYRVGATDPTTSLDEGDLFFNTTSNSYKFYDGSAWRTVNVSGIGSISDDSTPQLGGNLDVVTHSIVSTSNRDIAITPNGTGDVIIDGLKYPQADGSAGQFLKTDGSGQLSFGTVNTDVSADSSPQLGGDLDLNSNNITGTGNITTTGTATFTSADNNPQLIVKSTDADSSSGPEIELFRDSASPADDDALGQIQFNGKNDAAEKLAYAEIDTVLRDATDGTEDAELRLKVRRAGTLREALMIGTGSVVLNEGGEDINLRVESAADTSAFFVDGANSFIGMGTGSPAHSLHIERTTQGDARILLHQTGTGGNDDTVIRQTIAGTTASNFLQFGDVDDNNIGEIEYDHGDNSMRFTTNAVERMRLDNAGRVAIGDTSASTHLHLNITGTGSRRARFQNSEGSADFGTDGNRALIWVAGNQKLRIDAGGAVYLNTEGGNLSTGVHVQQGSSKAWGAFEQSGTHSFRDSYNMTSISDQGTGISRITINNNMNNSNYATVGMSGEQAGGGNRVCGLRGSAAAPNTGRFDMANFALSTGSSSDDTRISISVLGDQA